MNVWDYSNSTRVNKINTGLAKVNMSLVSETDGALLLTGCDDGAVKIWRNYGEMKTWLVTAWSHSSQPLVSGLSVRCRDVLLQTVALKSTSSNAKIVCNNCEVHVRDRAFFSSSRLDQRRELCRETLNL